jgi:inosine/xanthosine triphosphatase
MPESRTEILPDAVTAAFARVVVGSGNPVKVAAVRAVVRRIRADAAVRGVAVPSGVPDQPWGDAETIAGARTRAEGALAADPEAALAVGLEGGVVADGRNVRTCAWAVALDRAGRHGTGGSLAMPLPAAVAAMLADGDELGPAMDRFARTTGTKYGRGAVGILTAGLIDRQAAYEPLVAYALAPWLAPEAFTASGSGR